MLSTGFLTIAEFKYLKRRGGSSTPFSSFGFVYPANHTSIHGVHGVLRWFLKGTGCLLCSGHERYANVYI